MKKTIIKNKCKNKYPDCNFISKCPCSHCYCIDCYYATSYSTRCVVAKGEKNFEDLIEDENKTKCFSSKNLSIIELLSEMNKANSNKEEITK